jgi:putative SOS response-associated peptidase YedK
MSSRYSLSLSHTQLEQRFAIEVVAEAYQPTYNAAPAQLLPVITNTGSQGLSFFYWGLVPQWAKNKTISDKIINTQEELIREKTILKKNLRQQRCIVPADGFYEWKKVGKKIVIPYRFTLKSKEAFAMAGLWEEYDDENGEFFHTFTLITTKANALVSTVVERMPVILTREIEKEWLGNQLSEDELIKQLLALEADKMDCFTVSSRVNDTTNNDALIIRPAPASDQYGNLTLFD